MNLKQIYSDGKLDTKKDQGIREIKIYRFASFEVFCCISIWIKIINGKWENFAFTYWLLYFSSSGDSSNMTKGKLKVDFFNKEISIELEPESQKVI